jgi:hypothetical protein
VRDDRRPTEVLRAERAVWRAGRNPPHPLGDPGLASDTHSRHVGLQSRRRRRVEGGQVLLKKPLGSGYIEGWEEESAERLGVPDCVLGAARRQVALRGPDHLVYIGTRREGAEVVDRHASRHRGYLGRPGPQVMVVEFDALHRLLQLLVERHRMGPKDQLVQFLPLLRTDDQARVDVLVHKHIVEHHHVRQRSVPRAILEHRRRRAASAVEHGVRRMQRGEATPLSD